MSELEPKIRFFKFTKQFPQILDNPDDGIWFHKDSICVMFPLIEKYVGDSNYGVVSEGYTHTEGRTHPTTVDASLFYKYNYGYEVIPEDDNFDPKDIPSYNEVIKTIETYINKHLNDIMDIELQIRSLKEIQSNKNRFVRVMEKIIND